MIFRFGALFVLAVLTYSGGLNVPPAWAQFERDYIRIVGARRVYPYMSPVVEQFGQASRFKYPEIIVTNAIAGHRMLCAGQGLSTSDITVITSKMTPVQQAQCEANDAGNVTELILGRDTVVAVVSRQEHTVNMTATQLFLALAERIPDPSVENQASAVNFVTNSYRRWRDIDPELPDAQIRIVLPPRDAFETDLLMDSVMRAGCNGIAAIAALEEADPEEYQALCGRMRQDSLVEEFVGSGEDLVVRMALIEAGYGAEEISDPSLYQFFPDPEPPLALAFTRPHKIRARSELEAVSIEGVAPTQKEISDGNYLISRPVYLRIKSDHFSFVPGMRDLVAAFLSAEAIGPEGYLIEQGLTPLPERERAQLGARLTRSMQLHNREQRDEEEEEETREVPTAQRLRELEEALWTEASESGEAVSIERYIALFPNGAFADDARRILQSARETGPCGRYSAPRSHGARTGTGAIALTTASYPGRRRLLAGLAATATLTRFDLGHAQALRRGPVVLPQEWIDNSVKIGLLQPLDGPMAPLGKRAVAAAKEAMTWVNRKGGVASLEGKPLHGIEVGIPDTPTGAADAVYEAQQQGVVAILWEFDDTIDAPSGARRRRSWAAFVGRWCHWGRADRRKQHQHISLWSDLHPICRSAGRIDR